MSNLVKIDPKEFGLEEKSVKTIEVAFAPKIAEREGLAKVYETLITKELSPDLCVEAKELRRKLVKVRTGIADIHRTQKAFFLASGRFVDAWKTKETLPVSQMEEKLSDIEKHFENIEKERIEKIESERNIELSKYDPEMLIPNLGEMEESVWKNFIQGIKLSFEQRKSEEEKAEKERLRLIEVDKEEARLKAIEDERIRKENESLKKAAEEKEAKISARNTELRPYIVFIRDYDSLLNSSDTEYEKQLKDIKKGAELQWKFDRAEIQRVAKEESEREAKAAAVEKLLIDEKAKAKKLKGEIEAKEASAEEELKAKQLAEKAAAQAPDKDKLIKSINEMSFIDAEFKTAEAEAVYNVINQKFEAFKTWAINQTKSL
jgi:hypothetical protein